MTKSKSSKRWLDEHFNDVFVKESQKDGYRSRAAYKLIEIAEKDQLLRPGMSVVDLGAAPGGWTQVLSRKLCVGNVGNSESAAKVSTIVATDILSMDPLPGVEFIQGDFTEDAIYEEILELVRASNSSNVNGVDLVLSDMAPNMSGIKDIDQPRSNHLFDLAFDFSCTVLKEGGSFLCKVFQGEGFDDNSKRCRESFGKVLIRKPSASRPRSNEVYILARGKR